MNIEQMDSDLNSVNWDDAHMAWLTGCQVKASLAIAKELQRIADALERREKPTESMVRFEGGFGDVAVLPSTVRGVHSLTDGRTYITLYENGGGWSVTESFDEVMAKLEGK